VRLALATAAAWLVMAAPAAAQHYEPVVGGGSFNAAPILEPGSYRDTLLPSEYLYYGFRLEPGQRLHVTANAELSVEQFTDLALADITANLHAPSRDGFPAYEDYDARGSFRTEPEPQLDMTGPYADAEPDEETKGAWFGPGVYFLAFYANYVGDAEPPPRAEVPFHFEVEIEGDAQSTPTPTPSPSPTATATPAPTAAPEADDSGPKPAVAAGFGVGGLLAGVIAGIALRRRKA
jgi:hypothetical protein